jgi:hypothetical protein
LATPAELYLDLLARSITATLYSQEPNHENPNVRHYIISFVRHYIRGNAITMLPRVRLNNIKTCVEAVIGDRVSGDLIEAGVWRGGGAMFMRGCLEAFGDADRTVWVADSFEGLPEPDVGNKKEYEFYHSDMMTKHYEKMAAGYDEVVANFRAYNLLSDKVQFLKGWFKDTLPVAPIEELAVMRLDCDYYSSTTDALAALYPKLQPGGFVIIDDYGEDLWTDCRKAVDDFRRVNDITDPIVYIDSRSIYWRRR